MPTKDNEIPINYTKEAFLHPANLCALLVCTVLGFASGGLGFPVSLILTVICAVELLYLGVVPKMPRIRKLIKLRKLSEKNAETNAKDLFKQLDESSKRQYLVLRRLVKLTKNDFDNLPYASQGMLQSIRDKLDKLLEDYLMLLDLHKKYKVYISSSLEKRLQQELTKEKEGIDAIDSDKLRQTKSRRIKILQKRLKKFERAREKYLITETHLETIEDAIRYIHEQSMTMSNPEEVGVQLDTLLSEMDETSSMIEEWNRPTHGMDTITEDQLDIELQEAMETKQKQSNQQVKN